MRGGGGLGLQLGGKDLSSCHTLEESKDRGRRENTPLGDDMSFIKLTKAGDLCSGQQTGESEVSACEGMVIVGWSPTNRNKLIKWETARG